jgi:hypothetical protein
MKPTQLKLYKIINGKRRMVTFTIDETRLILAEDIGSVPGEDPIIEKRLSGDNSNPRLAFLDARGIKHHKDEQGRVIIDSISSREQKIMTFFSDLTPCWFDGCEELRKEYKEDYAKIGGANCKACTHGALIRKYMEKVDATMGELNKNEVPENIISSPFPNLVAGPHNVLQNKEEQKEDTPPSED